MSFTAFFKDKILYFALLLFVIITSEILLLSADIILYIRIYIGLLPIILFFIALFVEYYNKNKYYSNLKNRLEELEEKYLISEVIKKPEFSEGKILKEVLEETGKSMLENVNKYKRSGEDYKEYIELWIHEIKIPIATSKMIIENNKTKITQSINEELDKIENYIEQALYYARSNTVEKDYIIKKVNLKEIVNNSILKNKVSLIQNKVNVNIHDIERYVYTDSKWCIFILNQIIQNSIKYSKKENRKLDI